MNHFVVIFPLCIPGVQNQLTNHFNAKGFAWWHWGAEVWLIATDQNIDAADLRRIIHEVIIVPQLSFLVLRVDLPQTGINWASAGATLNALNWKTWLQQFWEDPNWRP